MLHEQLSTDSCSNGLPNMYPYLFTVTTCMWSCSVNDSPFWHLCTSHCDITGHILWLAIYISCDIIHQSCSGKISVVYSLLPFIWSLWLTSHFMINSPWLLSIQVFFSTIRVGLNTVQICSVKTKICSDKCDF